MDRWLADDADLPPLTHAAILAVVEGIASTSHEELSWRDEQIQRLVDRRDEAPWRLAALLACFAWPADHPPSVAVRHTSLREHVERLPARMIPTGLDAMWREALEHPIESIQTALKLLSLMPDQNESFSHDARSALQGRELWAVKMVELAKRALWAMQQSSENGQSTIDWTPVLEVVVSVPPTHSKVLDGFLSYLAVDDLANVERFVKRWIRVHGDGLLAHQIGLHDLWPLCAADIGERLAGWLLDLAVERDSRVRYIAIASLSQQSSLTEEMLGKLSLAQARGLSHALAGSGMAGSFWIPAVFSLARAQPRALDEILPILRDEALRNYPKLCRDQLERWDADRPGLRQAREELTSQIGEQQSAYVLKVQVPEIVTQIPSDGLSQEAHERAMQQAEEHVRRSGRFPLMAMLSRVPLARGQSTIHRIDDQVMNVPLRDFSMSFELPFLEHVDPVYMAMRRREHWQRADAILQASEPGSGE